jgi:hypothetical protein
MLSGQSKTLEEAEDEYRRRYRRETPKWFPKWYEFAAARNALFIDEFDNIEDNFAPFRDLSGAEMRKRLTAALRIPQSFAYHIKDGEVSRTRNSDAPQWTIDWRGPGLEE